MTGYILHSGTVNHLQLPPRPDFTSCPLPVMAKFCQRRFSKLYYPLLSSCFVPCCKLWLMSCAFAVFCSIPNNFKMKVTQEIYEKHKKYRWQCTVLTGTEAKTNNETRPVFMLTLLSNVFPVHLGTYKFSLNYYDPYVISWIVNIALCQC